MYKHRSLHKYVQTQPTAQIYRTDYGRVLSVMRMQPQSRQLPRKLLFLKPLHIYYDYWKLSSFCEVKRTWYRCEEKADPYKTFPVGRWNWCVSPAVNQTLVRRQYREGSQALMYEYEVCVCHALGFSARCFFFFKKTVLFTNLNVITDKKRRFILVDIVLFSPPNIQ